MSCQEKLCRVCHSGGQFESRLISPCKCNGSMKYVHETCLLVWLNSTGRFNSKCEICSQKFRFENVYSEEPASRELRWEIAKSTLTFMQTLLKCGLYLVLPAFSFWWFQTSWCLIFQQDEMCAPRQMSVMLVLSFSGMGLVLWGAVAAWAFLMYLSASLIYVEFTGARENYLNVALRKRLADKAARWESLEEACIDEERRNFAFADFESLRLEWDYEKQCLREDFKQAHAHQDPNRRVMFEDANQEELTVGFNCDIVFCTMALEQLSAVSRLGGAALVAHYQHHYVAWLKVLHHNRTFFVEKIHKFCLHDQLRTDKLRVAASQRYDALIAANKARAALANASPTAPAAAVPPQQCVQEHCGATDVPAQALTPGASPVTDGAVASKPKIVKPPVAVAEEVEVEVPAAPLILKLPKKRRAETHQMMQFYYIGGVYCSVLMAGIAVTAMPVAVGKFILWFEALSAPLTQVMQTITIALVQFCALLTFGVCMILEVSPAWTLEFVRTQEMARFVLVNFRQGMEFVLGYSIYVFFFGLCGAFNLLKAYCHEELDGPLVEMLPQFAKYFAFQRSLEVAKTTAAASLYAIVLPGVIVWLLRLLDGAEQSCDAANGTCWHPHVEYAYRTVTWCLFVSTAVYLLVYALQVCDDLKRFLGSRVRYTSPRQMLEDPTLAISYRTFFLSYAFVLTVTLALYASLVAVPLTAARWLVPAFRYLVVNNSAGGNIVQWSFILVYMRCVINKLITTRAAAWFAYWVNEYLLLSAPSATHSGAASASLQLGESSTMLHVQEWVNQVCLAVKKSSILYTFTVIACGAATLAVLSAVLLVHPLFLATYIMRRCEAPLPGVGSRSLRVLLYYPAGAVATWLIAYTARHLALELVRGGASAPGAWNATLRTSVVAAKLLAASVVWLGAAPLLVGVLLHEVALVPAGCGHVALSAQRVLGEQINSTVWTHGFLITTAILLCAIIAHDDILRLNAEKVNNMLTFKHIKDTHAPALLKLLEFAAVPGLAGSFTALIPQQYSWAMRYTYHAYVILRVCVFLGQSMVVSLRAAYNDIVDAKYLVGKQLMNCDERSAFSEM